MYRICRSVLCEISPTPNFIIKKQIKSRIGFIVKFYLYSRTKPEVTSALQLLYILFRRPSPSAKRVKNSPKMFGILIYLITYIKSPSCGLMILIHIWEPFNLRCFYNQRSVVHIWLCANVVYIVITLTYLHL